MAEATRLLGLASRSGPACVGRVVPVAAVPWRTPAMGRILAPSPDGGSASILRLTRTVYKTEHLRDRTSNSPRGEFFWPPRVIDSGKHVYIAPATSGLGSVGSRVAWEVGPALPAAGAFHGSEPNSQRWPTWGMCRRRRLRHHMAMQPTILSRAQRLSDHDLIARVRRLARHEREATAVLVAHLTVFDERSLYLGEGCPSMFSYCTQVLHLAEHAAYNRIEAARAVRRFPVLLTHLAEGALTLATVRILAPHLTPGNHDELIASARFKSKRAVENLVADLCPLPAARSTIRTLPSRIMGPLPVSVDAPGTPVIGAEEPTAGPPETAFTIAGAGASSAAATPHATCDDPPCLASVSSFAAAPACRVAIEPLGSRRYRVQFTAPAETCDKLRLAQDLLRHQLPDGDVAEIMDRALTLLLETLIRQKFAATKHPRTRPATSTSSGTDTAVQGRASRHIPAEVRRAVWLRDGGRCAFVASNGRRCNERGFLEFHHVEPYSKGGAATADNLQLRCRRHNRYEAELCFGRDMIAAAIRSHRVGDAGSLPSDGHAAEAGANGQPPPRADPG